MHSILVSVLGILMLSGTARAQSWGALDTTIPAWHQDDRDAAIVMSTILVGSAIGLEAWRNHSDWHALVRQGERTGLVIGLSFATKYLVHRQRPCAPSDCAPDNPSFSFFSMHTALTSNALARHNLGLSISFSVGEGYMRVAANKHWVTDTLIGALVGFGSSYLIPDVNPNSPPHIF